MGHMGFCKILQVPAIFGGSRCFPGKICTSQLLSFEGKGANQQDSATICKKKTETLAPVVILSLSLLVSEPIFGEGMRRSTFQ